MYCSVCKGSGLSPIPHVPTSYGGWADEVYMSMMECGGCNGTGRSSAATAAPVPREDPKGRRIGMVMAYNAEEKWVEVWLDEPLFPGALLSYYPWIGEPKHFVADRIAVNGRWVHKAEAGEKAYFYVPFEIRTANYLYL